MKKIALAALLAFLLWPAASNAQVYVRVGPPAPIVERRPPPPERGFVWIGGYHRWDGERYVWVPGRWDRRHIRMQSGFVITGCIAMADGCWLRGTGGRTTI